MLKKIKRFVVGVFMGACALVCAAPAMAADATATIDSAPIVATITSGITVVSAIGVAVLSLVVTIKLFKWVQRVL